MSVLLETSLGDLVIDLFAKECPKTAENFIKLCKIKYYNNCLFYDVQKDYLAQTGDPTDSGNGGSSIWGLLSGDPKKRYFTDERGSRKFNKAGLVAMANKGPDMNASGFFISLAPLENSQLHKRHTIFGRVAEGLDVLEKINSAYLDQKGRPFQNIRIRHTVIIDDPFQDPKGLREPSRSPSPIVIRKGIDDEYGDRLEDNIDINGLMKDKTEEQLQEEMKEHQTRTRAAVLEILDDLPDADIEPPKNVLFVCKLNPVTQEHDLELIFSRLGSIKKCEIIRDWKTGDSLQYAFIEYETEACCIEAYSRMENVLIDERRIHVDFSQSVAKLWNTHRRKTLKEAAGKILEQEQVQSAKEQKVYNPFIKKPEERRRSRSRDRHHRNESDRGRRDRSRERRDDKKKRRHSSSSSHDRRSKDRHRRR